MWLFLVPLLVGFALGGASAFTTAFSRRWGARGGQRATAILRASSVPFWSAGYFMAALEPSPSLFSISAISVVAGLALLAVGSALITWAVRVLQMRAVAPSVGDAVEAHGPYAYIRHPVYAGMILELAGVALVLPKWPVVVACVAGAIWVKVIARLEETDLLQRAPEYRGYMQAVRAFWPRHRRR